MKTIPPTSFTVELRRRNLMDTTISPTELAAVPCSAFVLRQFPKPCKPRKRHHCIICGTRIEIAEECCRWSGLDPGEGYATCHAHPECYAITEKWDEMDWECNSEEGPRETPRMYWPNQKLTDQ